MKDDWLSIFAKDHKESNFRSYVVSIDVGRQEFWTCNIHWDSNEEEIYFFTQYEPKLFCREENCIHWPRSHWEDITLNYRGKTLWTQLDAV